jgi:hypothetical protein
MGDTDVAQPLCTSHTTRRTCDPEGQREAHAETQRRREDEKKTIAEDKTNNDIEEDLMGLELFLSSSSLLCVSA